MRAFLQMKKLEAQICQLIVQRSQKLHVESEFSLRSVILKLRFLTFIHCNPLFLYFSRKLRWWK